MHARLRKHTAHIDLQRTVKGIPFIKDLQAALCLFVCICDYGLAAFTLLSHPQCQRQNTVLCTSLFGAILYKQEPVPGTFDSGLSGGIKCLTFKSTLRIFH